MKVATVARVAAWACRTHVTFLSYLAVCAAVAIALAVADAATVGQGVWNDGKMDAGHPDYFQCEHPLYPADLIREKASTYSNLSIFYAGLYVAFCACVDWWRIGGWEGNVDRRNELGLWRHAAPHNGRKVLYNIADLPSAEACVAIGLLYLGTGSFLAHAAGYQWERGNFMDVSGIVLCVYTLMLVYGVAVLLHLAVVHPGQGPVPLNVLLATVAGVLAGGVALTVFAEDVIHFRANETDPKNVNYSHYYAFGACVGTLFVVIMVAVGAARYRRLVRNKDFILMPLALLCLGVAVASWVPEYTLKMCVEPLGIKLHAVWHGFLGLAILFMFLWLRHVNSNERFWERALWRTMIPKPKSADCVSLK